MGFMVAVDRCTLLCFRSVKLSQAIDLRNLFGQGMLSQI